jgi:hypothetical protein
MRSLRLTGFFIFANVATTDEGTLASMVNLLLKEETERTKNINMIPKRGTSAINEFQSVSLHCLRIGSVKQQQHEIA